MTELQTNTELQFKVCTKCGVSKPLTDYCRNRRLRDGRNPHCKACQAEYHAAYYQRNKERLVEYQRAYDAAHKPEFYMRREAWRQAVPGRRRAHNAVYEAVKRGDLPHVSTQFCFVGLDACNVEAEQYHHIDYSEHLVVIPVCRSCHQRWHAANPEVAA